MRYACARHRKRPPRARGTTGGSHSSTGEGTMTHPCRRFLAALLFPLSLALPAHAADTPKAGEQAPEHFEKQVPVTLDYLLYLPADYGKDTGKKWPLIMFLHGSG